MEYDKDGIESDKDGVEFSRDEVEIILGKRKADRIRQDKIDSSFARVQKFEEDIKPSVEKLKLIRKNIRSLKCEIDGLIENENNLILEIQKTCIHKYNGKDIRFLFTDGDGSYDPNYFVCCYCNKKVHAKSFAEEYIPKYIK